MIPAIAKECGDLRVGQFANRGEGIGREPVSDADEYLIPIRLL